MVGGSVMPPEKPLREMTPAELFDEITADGSNFSDKASRARMAGLEALRRLQAAESDRAAVREAALREALTMLDSYVNGWRAAVDRVEEPDEKPRRETSLRTAVGIRDAFAAWLNAGAQMPLPAPPGQPDAGTEDDGHAADEARERRRLARLEERRLSRHDRDGTEETT
jgi:hypothetical protein